MPWPVLLMARALEGGGSERQLREIAKALDRTRFEPHAACFRPSPDATRELTQSGVRIAHFPVYSFASARAIAGAFSFAAYIRRNKIRLVHSFDYPTAVFAIPAARLLTSAVAVSSQRSHRDLIPPGYRRIVRWTDRLARSIVVNCEYIRRHLENDEHVAASRIALCYNGIDLDVFRPLDEPRPPQLRGRFVIGVLCALRPEKGLSTLLHAFEQVRQAHPAATLAIVGDGPVLPALKEEARSLGIAGDCIFAPATSSAGHWLRAMNIFVLPSLSEAFSNSLMEAMACARPVIASNTGGNPELVRNGETGLLFETGNPAALAQAISTLIQDDALRHRLAQAGAEFIRSNFSIQSSARHMGDIYARLIEAR